VPLGQGLFINQRMADLRKAKMQMQLGQAERKLQAIAVLMHLLLILIGKNHEEFQMYSQYNTNAETRYKAIQSLIKEGTKELLIV
jgi:hypothetical protein